MAENGEILTNLKEQIEDFLKRPKLSKDKFAEWSMMLVFVTYLIEDHPKVKRMWNTYVPMAWGMAIAAATFIGLMVSGKVSVIIR